MGYFQALWSAEILDEATRNLVDTGRMNEEQSTRLTTAMHRSFPEALVENYESLIPSMPNQEKDRHVAAVAVKANAEVIVTSNLKDFQELPPGIEAQSPDEFLVDLLDLAPMEMLALLEQQAKALKNPPVDLEELLIGLSTAAPRFVEQVRKLRTA